MSRAPETFHAAVGIIGAGPAGTATAAHLAQLGVRDVVLVDRHGFPRDKTCGSGVSPKGIRTLKALGVFDEVEPHARWIRGMRLVTRGGREAWLSGGRSADAIVCRRRILDHILLRRATGLGVRFVDGFTAADLIEEDGRIAGFTARDGRRVRCRVTVVAGGAHCKLTTRGPTRPERLIQAIMGWWSGVPHREDHIEMVFDELLGPYYGWLFPEGDGVVNIGITYEDPARNKKAREIFARFLDKHYGRRLAGAQAIGRLKGHPIAYDYAVRDLTSPGRIVVGEAGRMTHPATAEGIYQGMRSGMLAAEAIADLLAGRAGERAAWARYERRCRAAFALSFAAGGLFRKIVQTPLLDWVVESGRRPVVRALTARLMAQM